jgi:gliding motility-associated-like protein
MMRFLPLLFSACVFWALPATAQDFRCGTDEAHQHLKQNNATYAKAIAQNEWVYQRFLETAKSMDPHRSTGCAGAELTVPIVVHVIHLGEPVGSSSNISDAQVLGAIQGLNDRWRGMTGDGADMGFSFCLARRDPQGNPTTGIVRVDGSGVPGYTAGGIQWSGGAGAEEAAVKALSTWPQARYYNVWVVHTIGGGVGGYAYFPNGGPLDGTVIRAGSMTQGSSTLAHELGHGYNLFHTFQGDNDGANCPPDNDCTQDGDRVCDTPPHKVDDCGGSNPCTGQGIWENSRRNYMSYCGGTTRFTAGQGVRVTAASLGNARASLFTSEGCIPADQAREGGLLAIVFPFEQPLCEDTFEPILRIKNYGNAPMTSITIEAWLDGAFYHASTRTGNLAPGAEINLTLDPITVTPGPHAIDYRIVDINGGGTDTYPANDELCTNLYYEPTVTTFPHCWDFESGEVPPGWTTRGALISVASHANPGCTDQGNYSLVFNAFNAGAGGGGTNVLLAMTPMDLTGMTRAALNFDVAMRRNFLADHRATLEVLVSDDCGLTLTPVYRRRDLHGGQTEDLHTVPHPASQPTSSWVPTQCSHWRRDIADLSAFAGKEVLVVFRFTIDRAFSENLYIDNICVQSCEERDISIEALTGPALCIYDTARMQVTVDPTYDYQWFRSLRPLRDSTNSHITTRDTGYYFAAVYVDGCRYNTDTLFVFYHPAVTTTITGELSVCQGDSATLDAGAGFTHYQWSTGDTTQILKVLEPGQYFVTITSPTGCTGEAWTQVSTKIKPNANITGLLEFCEGGQTTISVSQFAFDVLWNTGETSTSIVVQESGTYRVTVTGSNGCSGTNEVVVNERILPPLEIQGVLAICSGESTTLDAGPGWNLYNWEHGPFSRMVNISTAGTYSVTVTDNLGCTTSGTVDVTENEKPTPAISGANLFCAGSENILDAGGPYASYIWSTGAVTPTIAVTQSGPYRVTVTNAAGCTGTAQIVVTTQPSPAPQISGTTQFCEGETTTLNAGNNFFSYLWNDGSTEQTLSVNASGTYIVTVTNSIGCPGVDSVEVTAIPAPEPTISGVLAICEGEATTLDAGDGYASYTWSSGSQNQQITVTIGGTYSVTVATPEGCEGSASVSVLESPNPVPQIIGEASLCEGQATTLSAGAAFDTYTWSSGATTPSITVSTTGAYSLTVTNAAGCSGQDLFQVTVHPNPSPSISGNLSFCEGSSTILSVSGAFASYQWSTGDTAPSLAVTTAGTFQITVTDTNGCSGTTSASTTVLGLVNPTLTSIPSGVCPGQEIQLLASGGTDYLWLEGAAMLSDPTIPNPTVTLETSASFSVEVSNDCNSEVISIDLIVNTPQGEAGPDLNVLLGREVTLSASGGIRYTWEGPSALSCTDCPNPRTSPTASGHYVVRIEDVNGCITLDSVFVEVFDDLDRVLDLVNTITPNGDGINDILVIKGLESFDANSLTIFNRWGEQVFHQDNYQNGFDGTYKGKLLPSGSYYYILRLWPGDRVVKSVLIILHED